MLNWLYEVRVCADNQGSRPVIFLRSTVKLYYFKAQGILPTVGLLFTIAVSCVFNFVQYNH